MDCRKINKDQNKSETKTKQTNQRDMVKVFLTVSKTCCSSARGEDKKAAAPSALFERR